MACENLSKYYPIVRKFSGYLPLYEDTSAVNFGSDWSNGLAEHGPKVGHNKLHCSRVCEWKINFQGCYHYVFLNNLVLAIPKMEQIPQSGTFSVCKMVLFCVVFFSFHPCIRRVATIPLVYRPV